MTRNILLLLLGLLASPVAHAAERVDASALYNAGTEALRRGDLGPAVALLEAARRIDPRARDLRTNLAVARGRVEERAGSDTRATSVPSAIALSVRERWNAAALLCAIGSIVVLASRSRRTLVAGAACFGLGALLGFGLFLGAREESRHPQAVVVAPMLDVRPAPDERPTAPYLLAAGEEVRLGASKGDLVEIRIGGNAIGWAPRSGLWRVADAPRYTAGFGSR